MGAPGLEPGMPKPRFYRPLRYQFRSHTLIKLIGREGFEPPNPKELIYSQPALAACIPTNIVGQVGVEPTVFLMWGIYSPLPSPLGILTLIFIFGIKKDYQI